MLKTRTKLIILAVIVAAIGSLVAWVASQPSPGPPSASVTLLGYTNDASGLRLARFAITNLGSFAIKRSASYSIQIPSPAGWTSESGGFISGTRVLAAGASETLAVPAPTNQPSWRISILAYTDPAHTAVSRTETNAALLRAMLSPGSRAAIRHEIHSDPVVSER